MNRDYTDLWTKELRSKRDQNSDNGGQLLSTYNGPNAVMIASYNLSLTLRASCKINVVVVIDRL